MKMELAQKIALPTIVSIKERQIILPHTCGRLPVVQAAMFLKIETSLVIGKYSIIFANKTWYMYILHYGGAYALSGDPALLHSFARAHVTCGDLESFVI